MLCSSYVLLAARIRAGRELTKEMTVKPIRRRTIRFPFLLAIAASSAAIASPAQAQPAATPAASAASSATPSAPLPAARQVIDRYLKAIGGREAFLKRTSSHAKGTFEIASAGLRGDMEVYAAKPNRSLISITFPGVGSMTSGYDGTVGWSIDPSMGPMLLEGEQLEQRRIDADFFATLHEEKNFKSMETQELTEFEGRKAYKLKLVRHSGDEQTEYFDAETGLMLGSVVTRDTPMGPIDATSVIAEYKDFGGVKIPTRVTQRMLAGQEIVLTIATVEWDAVDPSVFDLPAEIKPLVTK